MAYDVVTLTIFFEISQTWIMHFRMLLTLIIDCQDKWASGYNYIISNIRLELVVWIHCSKVLKSVVSSNIVTCKLQLYLVAFRLIHYLCVDILYLSMNYKRHALSWKMDKAFVDLYCERYLQPDLCSPNVVVDKRYLYHMEVFMETPSCGNIISWYLWFQNINIKYWRRKQI